jgi:hypothetical protein
LSAGLARWRAPRAVHDPAKVLTDLAIAVALGGDCAADVAVVQITMLAADLLVWTQVLAFAGQSARRWEPKRLRLRLLAVAGRIICSGRRRLLRLPRGWPWSELIETGWTAMQPG